MKIPLICLARSVTWPRARLPCNLTDGSSRRGRKRALSADLYMTGDVPFSLGSTLSFNIEGCWGDATVVAPKNRSNPALVTLREEHRDLAQLKAKPRLGSF